MSRFDRIDSPPIPLLPPPPPPPSFFVPPPPPPPPVLSTTLNSSFSPFAFRLRSYDLETWKVVPGILVPQLVCGSVSKLDQSGKIVGELLSREEALVEIEKICLSDQVLVGANIAYDLAVVANEKPSLLPLIFKLFDEGRVIDILQVQALDAIAGGYLGLDLTTLTNLCNEEGVQTGRYSLWNVVRMVLGRSDAKENNEWKLSYAFLSKIAKYRWPSRAKQYPLDDTKNPLEVALVQLGLNGKEPYRNLENVPDQAETAFALQLGAVWGLRTDRERVAALRKKAEEKRRVMTKRYQALGFLRKDGREHQAAVRRAVAIAYGASGTCPRCGGEGQFQETKKVTCRGEKIKGRYQGCSGPSCPTCQGSGRVDVLGEPVTCWMASGGCDGTGLDVRQAPTLSTITTPTGRISTSRDTLSESGDEDLHDYGESEHDKVLDTYLPFLEQGIDRPINLSPNTILETLRASYSGVIQLFPQKGGVRECVVARKGWVYCSVDYAALELCTVSQLCLWVLGCSRQAEVINKTKNPGMLHTSFGARMIGMTVEEMVAAIERKDTRAKNTRQAAKTGNFSFWGGAGAATTVLTNRAKSKGSTKAPDGLEYPGIRFCILLDNAERCGEKKVTSWGGGDRQRLIPPTCLRCLRVVQDVLRPAWYAEWPESKPYFDWVAKVTGSREGRKGTLPCYGRKFWSYDRERGFQKFDRPPIEVVVRRGGVRFTDGANGGFQTLAALGAKYALRKVTRESYLDRDSPMYGTRPIFFAHDEIVSEMREETAWKAAPRKAQVMREAMKVFVPDVYIGADPALMYVWSKDADTVYDQTGKLTVWEPK